MNLGIIDLAVWIVVAVILSIAAGVVLELLIRLHREATK